MHYCLLPCHVLSLFSRKLKLGSDNLAVPAIRQWTCHIFVFRFYFSGVAAALRACEPAVSMITLTTWYFYDQHLDWENYPAYWPLSIVLALYCNNYDFSSLTLKRVRAPQLVETAFSFVTISCIKLDLDSILKGYSFLRMLPSGDLLNFGYKSNNHGPNYFW